MTMDLSSSIVDFFGPSDTTDLDTLFIDLLSRQTSLPASIYLIQKYSPSYHISLRHACLSYIHLTLTQDIGLGCVCGSPIVLIKYLFDMFDPGYDNFVNVLIDLDSFLYEIYVPSDYIFFIFLVYFIAKDMSGDYGSKLSAIRFLCGLKCVALTVSNGMFWGLPTSIYNNRKEDRTSHNEKHDRDILQIDSNTINNDNIGMIKNDCMQAVSNIDDSTVIDPLVQSFLDICAIHNFVPHRSFPSRSIIPFFLEGVLETFLYKKYEKYCIRFINKKPHEIRELGRETDNLLNEVSSIIHAIILVLIRNNSTCKSHFLNYLLLALLSNLEKRKMEYEKRKTGSDGFFVNLNNVLIRFCNKIVNGNGMGNKIWYEYINKVSKIINQVSDVSSKKQDICSNDCYIGILNHVPKEYNEFITKIFTYTVVYLNLGYIKIIEDMENLEHFLDYQDQQLRDGLESRLNAYRAILLGNTFKNLESFVDFCCEQGLIQENKKSNLQLSGANDSIGMSNKLGDGDEIFNKVKDTVNTEYSNNNMETNKFEDNGSVDNNISETVNSNREDNRLSDTELVNKNVSNTVNSNREDNRLSDTELVNKNVSNTVNSNGNREDSKLPYDGLVNNVISSIVDFNSEGENSKILDNGLAIDNIFYDPIITILDKLKIIYARPVSDKNYDLIETMIIKMKTSHSKERLLEIIQDISHKLSGKLFDSLIELYSCGDKSNYNEKTRIRLFINRIFRNDINKNIARLDQKEIKYICCAVKDLEKLLGSGLDAILKIKEILKEMNVIKETNNDLYNRNNNNSRDNNEENPISELEEKIKHQTNIAKGSFVCALESFETILYIIKLNKKIFKYNETKQLLINTLNYNLKLLVGPKCSSFTIENMEKYNFKPKKILKCIILIYTYMEKELQRDIVKGRDFNINLIKRAERILEEKGIANIQEIEKIKIYVQEITIINEELKKEEEIEDIKYPEEFLDTLTFEVMKNPVRLLTSNNIIDKSTFDMIMVCDGVDPFNRKKLERESAVEENELKRKIEDFIRNYKN